VHRSHNSLVTFAVFALFTTLEVLISLLGFKPGVGGSASDWSIRSVTDAGVVNFCSRDSTILVWTDVWVGLPVV